MFIAGKCKLLCVTLIIEGDSAAESSSASVLHLQSFEVQVGGQHPVQAGDVLRFVPLEANGCAGAAGAGDYAGSYDAGSYVSGSYAYSYDTYGDSAAAAGSATEVYGGRLDAELSTLARLPHGGQSGVYAVCLAERRCRTRYFRSSHGTFGTSPLSRASPLSPSALAS